MAREGKWEDRAEANANLLLWCVHVMGPDDVHPAESHAEAVAQAEALNRAIWSRGDKAFDDILSFAYASPYHGSKDSHVKGLARKAAENEKPRAALQSAEPTP